MLLLTHPAAREFVDDLNGQLVRDGHAPMSRIQSRLIAFLITAMVFTQCLNFALFQRLTLGAVTERSLSWLFHWAKVPWEILIHINARMIISRYAVKEARIVIDDTERKRAKNTRKLFGVHKIKDKKCNGYVMGQEFVLLALVTDIITIPVDVLVYRPDPARTAWRRANQLMKSKGIPKSERPQEPTRGPEFPSKEDLAISLLCRFRYHHGAVVVRSVLFDGAYLTKHILRHVSRLFGNVQVISKLRCNQRVREGNRPKTSVANYFENRKPRSVTQRIRGGEPITIQMRSARLFVESLGRVMHVVAMRYTEHDEYRYIAAIDLTWGADDIVREFGFRWPIEVVFEDWKLYEGIGKAASQRGADGVGCALTLSLLADGFLITLSEQLRLAKSHQPLRTVGSLCRKIQYDVFVEVLRELVDSGRPQDFIAQLKEAADVFVDTRPSLKHMSGRDLPRAGPSPSLTLRFGST